MKKVIGVAALLLMFSSSSFAYYVFIEIGATGLVVGNWGKCTTAPSFCFGIGGAALDKNPNGDIFTLAKDNSSLTLQLSETHRGEMKDLIAGNSLVLKDDSGIALEVMKELGDVTGGYYYIPAGKYDLKTDGKFFYVTVALKQLKK